MFVEDILIAVNNKRLLAKPAQPAFGGLFDDDWHRNFIASVAAHAQAGRALSSKQSQAVLKFISNVRQHIIDGGLASADEIKCLLTFPEHRRPPYDSWRVRREARYLGDNLLGLRCNMDSALNARIKTLAGQKARFDWTHKIWIIPVQQCNLLDVQAMLHEYRFALDQRAAEYLNLCQASAGQATTVAFVEHDRSVLLVTVRDQDILAGWITEIAEGITL